MVNKLKLTHRGSKGVKTLNITEKNGNIVSLKCVNNIEEKDLMIITDSGVLMKMPLSQVSILRRATQGVRLIHLKDKQSVSTVAVVEKEYDQSQETEIETPNV